MICKICNPNKTIIYQCPCDELIIDEWGVSEMECPKCNGTMRRMVNGYWCPKCGKIVKDRVWDMGKAIIICEQCNKKREVEIDTAGDLSDVVCPKCRNEHIFFNDIQLESDNNCPIILGTGGCRVRNRWSVKLDG